MKGDRIGEFEEATLLAVRALAEHGPAYAVTVQAFLEEHAGREVAMGAVYAVLDRLERKSLVRSAFGEATPEPGGKRKRLFALTPHGLEALKDLRRVRETMWRAAEKRSAS